MAEDSTARKDLHEANRRSWNEATRAHNSHKRDQAHFFRTGGSTLFSDEIELLGDISGRSLVHLMCNAGQDTLSLARLGARVLGVDISDEAITFATALSRDAGIPARFERTDIYDWLASTDERFEVAYSSYGAIPWLSDLTSWARGIERVLVPGGRFILLEFHPMMWVFEEVASPAETPVIDRLRIRSAYSGGIHIADDSGVSDYVAEAEDALAPQGYQAGIENFINPHACHAFAWGVEEIVSALIDAGLRLTCLRDYPYSNGCKPFPLMHDVGEQRWVLPDEFPRVPLMLGITVEKPR